MKERNKKIKKKEKNKIYDLLKVIKEDKDSDDIDIEEIEIKTDEPEKDNIEDDTFQEKPELKDIYNKILDVLVKAFNKIRNKNKKNLLEILKEILDDNKKKKSKKIKGKEKEDEEDKGKDKDKDKEKIQKIRNKKGEELIKYIIYKRTIRKYYFIWKEMNDKEKTDKQKSLDYLKKYIIRRSIKRYFYRWKNSPDIKDKEIDVDKNKNRNNKLLYIVQKTIKRNYLIYYFQKWKTIEPKKVLRSRKDINKKDNKDVDNLIDNLLLNQDDEDEKDFEDLSDILGKDNKKNKKIPTDTQKEPKSDIEDVEKQKEKEKKRENDIKTLLLKILKRKKYYILYIYFYRWKKMITYIQIEKKKGDNDKMENVIKPKLIKIIKGRNNYNIKRYFYIWKEIRVIKQEDKTPKKENVIIEPPKAQLKSKIKKKKTPSSEDVLSLNQEEPDNRIIIQEEKEKLEPEIINRRKNAIKRIIIKRSLKRVFYKWYEISINVQSRDTCLDGIYGYCYTEHFTYESYEYAPIHGNIDSGDVSCTVQPLFSDFLKSMNLSVAAFNLFTFYSQLREERVLIKKKYLPRWRRVYKIKKIRK